MTLIPGQVFDAKAGEARTAKVRKSLLALGKSEHSFREQLAEACLILGIDLESLSANFSPFTDVLQWQNLRDDINGPRYEWTMRWILNKFRADVCHDSPCLMPQTWVLLRYLMIKINAAKAVHLLASYKYLDALRRTLAWLQKNMSEPQTDRNEFSSSFSPKEKNSPKKRKRDFAKPEFSGPGLISFELMGALIFSICDSLYQAQCLMDSQSKASPNNQAEQLGLSFKCVPEEAANIISDAFYLLNSVAQTLSAPYPVTSGESKAAGPWNSLSFGSYTETFTQLWRSRTSEGGEPNQSGHQAFSKYCLLPTLVLRHTFLSHLPHNGSTETLISKMKELIVTNTIEPLQKSNASVHISIADLGKLLTEQLRSSPVLNPSKRDDHQLSPKKELRQTDDEVHLMSVLICSFFKFAISCTSRGTPKARKEGNLFLQRLFDELKGCLAILLGPAASDARSLVGYSRALKDLLDQTLKHDVQLSIATIESVLEEVTGLFNEAEDQPVEWEMISLCLRNNTDVFLNSKTAIFGLNPIWRPKEFVKKLLTKLDTSNNDDLSAEPEQLYSLKLRGVLIPLLRAFANARDLLGFFEHWKEKLEQGPKAGERLSSTHSVESSSLSIWTDDNLLFTAQQMIEPYLSTEQIDMILGRIESQLLGLDSTQNEILPTSDLVILDCVVGGGYSDLSRTRLAHRTRSIYLKLGISLLESPRRYGNLRWRVWRILTSINRTWLSDACVSSIQNTCRLLADKASVTIDALGNDADGGGDSSFQEPSFAFDFITSLFLLDSTPHESFCYFKAMINRSVDRILELKSVQCNQLNEDLSQVLNPIEDQHNWNGQSVDIQSHDNIYLSCIALLLSQPTMLGFVDVTIQRRMLEQLSVLARNERYFKEASKPVVNYSWLWNYAQHCDAVYEQKVFADNVRHLQCKTLLDLFGSNRSSPGDASSEEYTSALGSLLGTPLLQFSAEDIISIADGVLGILRRWKDSSLGSIARHLHLLVKFAEAPRKTRKRMKVFENIEMEKNQSHEKSAVFVLAEIVSQHASSEEKATCNEALCHLTGIILGHVYATLTSNASVRYFTMFYQWIGTEIDREFTSAPVFLDDWTSRGSMLLVTMTALNYYHRNRHQVSEVLDASNLDTDKIRQQHFERVFRISSDRYFDWRLPNDRIDLAANLECLYGYMDLFLAHSDMLQLYQHLEETIEVIMNDSHSLCDPEISGFEDLQALFYKISFKIPQFRTLDAITNHLVLWVCLADGSARGKVLHYLQEEVPTLDCKTIDRLLSAMPLDSQIHLILGLTDAQKTGLQTCLTRKFLSLCRELQESKNWNVRIIAIRYLDLLLRKCSKLTSQYMVETLLSTITITASEVGGGSRSDHAAEVFTGLSCLFSAILDCHRPRLGGRYHLTVPVLQSLLRLLFVPHGTVDISAQSRSTFDESHAHAYARLLTTLCDPSPSAVAHYRQQINLNDETKRAKNVAGQHLLYLIMTYCECRISARFAAEGMKEALEPGLWAVLGCLDDDIRQTMNSGMETNSRAVWKRLYEDWKKFGEWQAGRSS